MISLFSHIEPLFYCHYDFIDFIWLFLHHCFIAFMILLICFVAVLFYCNYHLVPFFYSTTVFLRLRFDWLYLTSVTPLFYCNYHLADLFCCTTVLLQLWFGWFLLFHPCFIRIITWVISCIQPSFNSCYNLGIFFPWHHCFLTIII